MLSRTVGGSGWGWCVRAHTLRLLPLQAALAGLTVDPRPPGCLKLTGGVDQWRIRAGDRRVVYRVEDGRLVVVVGGVGPRGKVYR